MGRMKMQEKSGGDRGENNLCSSSTSRIREKGVKGSFEVEGGKLRKFFLV